MVIRHGLLVAAACVVLCGQTSDPALDPLDGAYKSLAVNDYESAIRGFLDAIEKAPSRASIRKDLAYAYLRVGESYAARDQFAEAVRLDPADFHATLEYAFLCHETGQTGMARHVFDQVRRTGDEASRTTAETAFQSIDRPLAEGIDRWLEALRTTPEDFNAHREVAILAEKREDLPLAAEHYLKAWKIRPERRYLLVELGRLWLEMGQAEQGLAALLAASRGAEPRAAESARKLLPDRYPYVYEFRQALDLDANNVPLREELAYLLEAMGRAEESRRELEAIPRALRERNQETRQLSAADARALGDRSYNAGYLRDALRYYSIAHEQDPLDFPVILQIGWTHNVMGQDKQAIRWFDMARKSPAPEVAVPAKKAFETLRPTLARFRTTVWLFPTYSSRWGDVFTYGQLKTEVKLGSLPLRAYVSMRLIGDTRNLSGVGGAEYLSESSMIFGAGLATSYWHGLMFWGEAGSAASYIKRAGVPRLAPDYRGGAAYYRGFGTLLGGRRKGAFFETNDDGVFVSRFQNDVVLYSQNRTGYTLPPIGALGGLQTQWYWNTNLSTDLRRQYWANAVELGPGLRLRWAWMPKPWIFSVSVIRGIYRITEGNPWPRMYSDVRVGFWCAGTR